MQRKIPLTRPSVGEEELRAIRGVLESGMLTQGTVTRQFETEFAKYINVENAVATSSGTTALDLALLTLGIGPGQEVLVPDFTFPATGNVVFHVGARPVLVDIDIKTYNVDPEKIEKAITERTKAIIPVHLFGQPAEMEAIMEVAERHSLYVIEDAACGIGATYHGKTVGTFGDVACFSFHPRKTLSTGEGGMFVTNNDEIAEKARALKDHGKKTVSGKGQFLYAGYNFRLSDILSAIGRVQLKKVDDLIKKRVELARRYSRILGEVEGISIPYESANVRHTYQTYCLMIKKERMRDMLIERLGERDIETGIGTYALHVQPCYMKHKDLIRMDLTSSGKAYRNTLALPLYNYMKEEDQDYVCSNLESLLARPAFSQHKSD
ncbi:MAG: DegT/DnrJ/EryC1/StrS family aminotransferase [Promethearchaeota archaeon]